MNKARLYLLKANFQDQEKTYYCPGCVELLGLLEVYPKLKEHVEVHDVDFPRPRKEIVSLLGEENQSCPVLILPSVPLNAPAHLKIQQANGRAFVEGSREIGEYFADAHGIGLPH